VPGLSFDWSSPILLQPLGSPMMHRMRAHTLPTNGYMGPTLPGPPLVRLKFL
jgi:hypothetical protein